MEERSWRSIDEATAPRGTTYPTAHGPCRVLLAGAGPKLPIILIHGYAASADHWQDVMPALVPNHPVYAPDLIGFGDAPKPSGAYTPDLWAEQVHDLLEAFELPRAIILGHSLGGLIALTAVSRFPERFAGLVLMDALGMALPAAERVLRGLPGALIRLLRAPGIGELIFWSLRGRRLLARSLALGAYHDRARAPVDAVATWLDLIHRPGAHRAYLGVVRRLEHLRAEFAEGELTLPALIIWGAEDFGLPPTLIEGFHRLLPQAEVVIIPDCGHIPHREHPDAVIAALRPFLESVESAAHSTGDVGQLLLRDPHPARDPVNDRATG